jgi:hypothetical protein
MSWLRDLFKRRQKPVGGSGTYVMDVEWHRSEELRPDRLGPSQEDVPDPVQVRDPWRPSRTLGGLPKI